MSGKVVTEPWLVAESLLKTPMDVAIQAAIKAAKDRLYAKHPTARDVEVVSLKDVSGFGSHGYVRGRLV